MTALGNRVAGALALVAALVVLTSCSDDAVDSGAVSAPSTTAASASADLDCAALIPDTAWSPLGWPSDAPSATEHAGRCERVAEGVGQVTVGSEAVPGAEADRADNARSVYDDECARLRQDGGYVAEPAEKLAPGQTACGVMIDDDAKTGVAELILLTPSDEVVQLRVAVVDATTVNRVTASFRALTQAALTVW